VLKAYSRGWLNKCKVGLVQKLFVVVDDGFRPLLVVFEAVLVVDKELEEANMAANDLYI
jgi:hypothetical protein